MKRVFAIAHKPLHIEEDFRPFDGNGAWRRRIDQQYNKGSRKQVEWFDAASRYAQRLVEVLGMQSMQALSLFNQTMGIKVLGELNEFIRTNMLGAPQYGAGVPGIKKTSGDADRRSTKHRKIRRTDQVIAAPCKPLPALQPTCRPGRRSPARVGNGKDLEQLYRYHLLDAHIRNKEEEGALLLQGTESIRQKVAALQEEERQVRNQLEQNKAGQRLQLLEKEKAALSEQAGIAARRREEILGLVYGTPPGRVQSHGRRRLSAYKKRCRARR